MLLFPSAPCRSGLRGPGWGQLDGGAGPPRERAGPGVPAEGLRGGARAGIAPGMSAAPSAPVAPGAAGDPDRGQRGEKGQAAAGLRRPALSAVSGPEGAGFQPEAFCCEPAGGSGVGSGGGACCAPTLRANPARPGAAVGGGQNRSLLFLPGPAVRFGLAAPQGRRQSLEPGGELPVPHSARGAPPTLPAGRPGRGPWAGPALAGAGGGRRAHRGAAGQEERPGPDPALTFPPHLDGQEEGGWQLPGR